jgi:hypothetical protein
MMISRAADDGRPLPRWVGRRVARSGELKRFAASVMRLDRAFEVSPPPLETPPPFLATRVRAVIERRVSEAHAEPERMWSRRTMAGVCAGGVALAGVLLSLRLLHSPEPAPSADGRVAILSLDRLIRSNSPGGLAKTVEEPIIAGAEELWTGTGRVARVAFGRLPSLPKLTR